MCVCIKHLWKTEGNFQKLVSPSTVGSGDCAQVIWLSWSVLYLLRYSSTHKHRCMHKHKCTKGNYKMSYVKKERDPHDHVTVLLETLQRQIRALGTEGIVATQALPWAQHGLAPASSPLRLHLSPVLPSFRDLATLPHFHEALFECYAISDVFLFLGIFFTCLVALHSSNFISGIISPGNPRLKEERMVGPHLCAS